MTPSTQAREAVAARQKLSQSPLHVFYTSTEPANNLSDSFNLFKLILKLVDLLEDGSEARDFVIGHLDGIAGSVVLRLRCSFGGLVELLCWEERVC